MLTADGRAIWLREMVTVAAREDERPVKMQGIMIDITDWKEADAALQQLIRRLELILSAVGDGIYGLDAAGAMTFVNPAAARMLGWEAAELLGKRMHEILHHSRPDGTPFPQAECPIHASLESGAVHHVTDEVFWSKDGTPIPVEYTSTPIRDGEIVGAVITFRNNAERQRAEAALRESEEKYRTILESIEEGYYEVNLAGDFTFFNSSLCRILGRSADEMLGVNNRRYMDAESTGKVFQTFNQVYRTGKPVESFEWQTVEKEGVTKKIEISVSLQRDAAGVPVGFRGIVRDITERKRLEEMQARRVRQAALRADVSLALTATTSDLQGVLQQCAEAAVRHLDAAFARIWIFNEPEQMLELRASAGDYTHLDGAHARVPLGAFKIGLIAQERRPHLTNDVLNDPRLSDPDWAQRKGIAAFAGYPLMVENQLIGVLAMFARHPLADDTFDALATVADALAQGIERKRAEETLRRAEEKYRGIFEDAVEGIYQSTPAGEFVTANPALARMLGYDSPADLIAGLTDIERQLYVDPECRAEFQQRLEADGVVRGLTSQVYRQDGSKAWVIESARVVRDQSGALLCYEGAMEDITQRRQLEEQLFQSQKIEAVGQLAGGIAHDFNNLLVVINGYSELLLRRLPPADASRQKVEEIKKAGERAAALTRQLLAFSRKQMLQPKVLNLNEMVNGVGQMLRRLIGEDIDLVLMLKPAAGRVKADPGQIEQVLINLAVNARDAMPQGGQLMIQTANAELTEDHAGYRFTVQPGTYVLLAISDTGTGMDAATQARIFEPFFTTKGVGKGTGLGLAMVYGIVKQSGGYIWVNSEPGHGTTFKIYLPRVDEEARLLRPEAAAMEMPRGSETVLLVEDEAAVRQMSREILEMCGYRVTEAADGNEAMALCERDDGAFDLLITDVVMPRMSGTELARRLAVARPEMRVLYMSGYTDQTIVRHGVLEDGTNFIQKPFSPDALARKAREVLDASRSS